jgi:hypothetical protein
MLEFCRQPLHRPQLRRVVIETFFDHFVAVPSLQRKFIERASFAIERGDIEYPMYDHTIAVDGEKINRPRGNFFVARKCRALVGDEIGQAVPRWIAVLLHGCVGGVKALDGFDVMAAYNGGDKFFNDLFAGHDGSRLNNHGS